MAFGLGAARAPKIPAGMSGAKEPSFWTILDGVLGGDTISEAKFNAKARNAALEQSAQQMKLRQGLANLLGVGDDPAQDAEIGSSPVDGAASPLYTPPLLRSPSSMVAGVTDKPIPALPSGRRRGLPTLSEAGGPLAGAILGGLPGAEKLIDLLSKAQPDIAIGPDGQPYSKSDPEVLKRRFGNPTVVNGRVVNLNDDKNLDAYIPEPPVKGAVPVYGEQGKAGPPIGWKMPDGALQAIASTEAATSGGRAAGSAPFQVVTIQMPDGSTQQMPLSQFIGATGGSRDAAQPAGPARPQQGPAGRSQSPADAAYAGVGAKAAAERFQAMQAAGSAAPGKIAQLQQIGALLDGVEGGKLAPLGMDVAQAANSIGFKIDPKLGNKEAATALSQQIALSFKDQLPGPLSNADRQFLIQMAPGLSQSAQGRKLMIESAAKVYQRQADVARMARAWQQKYGRLDAVNPVTRKGFDDNLAVWTEQNRLFPGK